MDKDSQGKQMRLNLSLLLMLASLTQFAPDRWHGAGGLCPSCPSGSRRLRSVAGTHKLSESPSRETERVSYFSLFVQG